MKNISLLLVMCVFFVGILAIFSKDASALIIIGDPYEANSWHQKFRAVDVGHFDNIEMVMESGGDFKTPEYFSDSSWNTNYYSSKHVLCSGNTIMDLVFEVIFQGQISKPLSFLFISRHNNIIKEKIRLFWSGFKWECHSVPDAGIMWLLGPAFIALGIAGRKKYKK